MRKLAVWLLSLCVTMSVVLAASGCSGQAMSTEGEIYPTYADDKEMMIGGWDSPIPTKENYQAAKDMGLTHIFLDQVYAKMDSPQYEEILSWCEELGLKTLLMSGSNLGTNSMKDWSEADWDLLYERAASPAADMICYWDEPYVENFAEVKWLVERHNAEYGNSADAPTFYVTFNPAAHVNGSGEAIPYDEYANRLWDEVLSGLEGKKFLSTDVYPLITGGGSTSVLSSWLPTLETMATLAAENDADFHMFIQSYWDVKGGNGSRRRINEEDLSYQVYTCMAFGITGFSYFTYTESFLSDQMTGGCVTRDDCATTELYGWAKELNAEIKKFDNVYLSFDWQGVYPVVGSENESGFVPAYDLLQSPLSSLSCASAVTATQDTLVGQFQDENGNDGLLVTNYSDPAVGLNDEVSITFQDANRALVYRNGERTVYVLQDGVLDLTLEAGEGVFVIPVKV